MKQRSFALAGWVYQRWLAVVMGAAFLSLAVQVRGLFGERGIAPLGAMLVRASGRGVGFLEAPSVFWWLGASGRTLELTAWGGVLVSALLFVGVWPRATALLGWALYLSFASVGEPFLSFQWDALLLEALLLSPFLLPGGFWVSPRTAPAPPVLGLWLSRFLLFRLMLLSGMVKLLSGDPSWRDLTALTFHYWTQPLPVPTSYWASQLPLLVQRVSCGITLAVELLLPVGIFLSRPFRLVAAAGFVVLQLTIAATGSYGFFNLLTLGLVTLLVDDAILERALGWIRQPAAVPTPRLLAYGATPVAGVLVVLASVHFAGRVGVPVPSPLEALAGKVEPLRSVNSYGLFASMTKTRKEIEIEGSTDGETWKTYRFRYKPSIEEKPVWAGLHMPRLDWQMWFASLSSCRRQGWMLGLFQQLLEGSEDVRGLFADPPFAGAPPRQIRSTSYDFHPASPAEHAATGAVWTSELVGEYCPTVELGEDRKLRVAR